MKLQKVNRKDFIPPFPANVHISYNVRLKPQITKDGICLNLEYSDKERYALTSPNIVGTIKTEWLPRGKKLAIWALWGLYFKRIKKLDYMQCNSCGYLDGMVGVFDNKGKFILSSWAKHLVGKYIGINIDGVLTRLLVVEMDVNHDNICQFCKEKEAGL